MPSTTQAHTLNDSLLSYRLLLAVRSQLSLAVTRLSYRLVKADNPLPDRHQRWEFENLT